MSKQKRTRTRQRKRKAPRTAAPPTSQPAVAWPLRQALRQAQDVAQAGAAADGLHALLPGEAPSAEMLAEMTRVYQAQIRSQPMWAEVVQELGEAEAERLLAQCRVELR